MLEFIDILTIDDGLKEKVRCWRNQDNVRKFMLKQHIISKKEHLAQLSGLVKDTFWVVFINDNPIGIVNLQNINREKLISEWGFYIGEEDYRGKGFGREILYKLLDRFFGRMGFETLLTTVLSSNATAIRIYEGFGFEKTSEGFAITFKYTKDDWLKYKKGNENGNIAIVL